MKEEILNSIDIMFAETQRFILDRCTLMNEDMEKYGDIYSLDMDEYPVCHFDQDDLVNHSFDLGVLYTLENLRKQIEKL